MKQSFSHGPNFFCITGDVQIAMPASMKNSHILIDKGKLTAFITPKFSLHKISLIRNELKEKLPSYMIPTHIFSINKFPPNKNKKIYVAELIKIGIPEKDIVATRVEGVLFESQVAKVIKMVWAEVFHIYANELRALENFFSGGGTSLSAVILSRKLDKDLRFIVSM